MDDYELQPTTLELLRIFQTAGENIQTGRDNDDQPTRAANLIEALSELDKGIVIIDLLTLFSEFERAVLIRETERLAGGGM